ncbi:MAG: trypsin-like peptidase domain-containing protein [Acidobacteria bacterium]|nr:trypsin-like peptidase domain-containing protein [Acidobacteriota bacterium]
MNRTLQVTALVGAMLGSILFGFMIVQSVGETPPAPAASAASAIRQVIPAAVQRPAFYEEAAARPVATVTLPDFADIYARVLPAVVSISATKFTDPANRPDGNMLQDPFSYFFGRPGEERNPHRQPRREESGGTGFVITPDGYILTNFHVVEGADIVRVALQGDNGQDVNFEGRVVGSDPATDIALVKIESDAALAYLLLGDSDRLRVGEWVMAIGNPFFYEDTLTVGVVSAKGRRLNGLSRDPSLDNYIQTDAAINVGNSGGPLLNLQGEVIGINAAVSRIGQGIGFTIPINMAKLVVPQLRESGRVARGAIGVTITDFSSLDADDREYWGLSDLDGAFIQDVTSGQPADRAGLRPGDAVVALDGEPLTSSGDLISRISAHRPGDSIDLTYLRNGRKRTARVRLGDREAIVQGASITRDDSSSEPERSFFHQVGIEVAELDGDTRRSFQIPSEVEGVVIADVSVRGDAYEKGLRPGMVILEVNRKAVSSLGDYRALIEAVDDNEVVAFYVWARTQGGEARNFITFRVHPE